MNTDVTTGGLNDLCNLLMQRAASHYSLKCANRLLILYCYTGTFLMPLTPKTAFIKTAVTLLGWV